MAFFNKSDSVPVNSSFLSYSFPNVTLFNKGQWEKKHLSLASSQYYYKITYPSDNDTKLTYFEKGTPTIYAPSHMYIHGLIHNNITGLTTESDSDLVGELVITFTNNSNSNILGLCILLKKSGNSSVGGNVSSIDKVINMINSDPVKQDQYITSIDLNLDLDIPKIQQCLIYKYNNNPIIILTEPITLTLADTALLISKLEPSTDLFTISAPNNYQNANLATKTSNPMEGDYKNDDEIYIDCKPTGASIKEVTTYQIPINSAFSKDLQEMDFMKTSVNFFVFIIGLIFIYFTVPITYKMLVVDGINSSLSSAANTLRTTRIRSADILLSAVFITLAILCFYNGFTKDNQFQMVTNGLFLITFYGLSLSIIQYSKLNPTYMTTNATKTEYATDKFNIFEQFIDFGELLKNCFVYLFTETPAGRPIVNIIAAEIITFIILLSLRYGPFNMDEKDFESYAWQVGGLAIPIGIPLFIFLLSPPPSP
jgi:hypothetical protein